MTKAVLNLEETICNAARKVFSSKGLDGTTVQDIANEAGTTKSMVNYYFRNKEKLFGIIFQEEFKIFFNGISNCLNNDLPIKEKISKIIEWDTQKFTEFPEIPIFILNEINRNPDIVFSLIDDVSAEDLLKSLKKQINAEAKAGLIKKIKAEDLLLNIQALIIFPFIGKPLMTRIFNMTEKQYKSKIVERKKLIAEMIWDSIKL